jgi:hypothetical protein
MEEQFMKQWKREHNGRFLDWATTTEHANIESTRIKMVRFQKEEVTFTFQLLHCTLFRKCLELMENSHEICKEY